MTISKEDIDREVKVFLDSLGELNQCRSSRGLIRCSRLEGHNGKHATWIYVGVVSAGITKVISWK